MEHVNALAELVDDHGAIAALLDRVALLRVAARRIRDDAGLDLGYTSSLEGPDLMVMRGWAGAVGQGLRNLEVPRGLGLGGKSFAIERPCWVPDYCSSSQITHEFDAVIREEGIGAMVAIPLTHDGVVLGVAYGALRERADLGDEVIGKVAQIAEPTATALHLAERIRGHTSAALSAERQRIAVALHDSVGAMLFGIGAEVRDMQLDACAAPELVAKLRGVEARISETAAAFRESLAVLDGVAPAEELTVTLRGDCDSFVRRTGIPARCVALSDVPSLDGPQCNAVVAVVREALVNVEKHAHATSVVVSVISTGAGVAVAVADDGWGWGDSAEATPGLVDDLYASAEHRAGAAPVTDSSSKIGLKACHDRLARVGGTLSVVGNEDGGLTVRAWAPSG